MFAQGHLVMVTGTVDERERLAESGEHERHEAAERLKGVVAAQLAKNNQAAQQKAQGIKDRRAHAKAEKVRVNMLRRQAVQRAREAAFKFKAKGREEDKNDAGED